MHPFTLADILTRGELRRARKLYRKADPGTFNLRCASEIIQPQLERIERALGQAYGARRVAYCCAYVFRMEGIRRSAFLSRNQSFQKFLKRSGARAV